MVLKKYEVLAELKNCHNVEVRAKNKVEAKKKAIEKLIKIASKMSNWNIDAEENTWY